MVSLYFGVEKATCFNWSQNDYFFQGALKKFTPKLLRRTKARSQSPATHSENLHGSEAEKGDGSVRFCNIPPPPPLKSKGRGAVRPKTVPWFVLPVSGPHKRESGEQWKFGDRPSPRFKLRAGILPDTSPLLRRARLGPRPQKRRRTPRSGTGWRRVGRVDAGLFGPKLSPTGALGGKLGNFAAQTNKGSSAIFRASFNWGCGEPGYRLLATSSGLEGSSLAYPGWPKKVTKLVLYH